MPASRSESTLARAIRETGKKIDFFKRNATARRRRLMERLGIDLVLDVGANTGQYARGLRQSGYKGRIISFEPLSRAFAILEKSASRDRRWKAVRMGLGDRDHDATLIVSGDSRASSFREMLPMFTRMADYFGAVGEETVPIRRLDSVWDTYVPARSRVYMKVDTQGYEQQVLRGARESLVRVAAVQLEMSLRPMYKGEPLLPEMVKAMNRKGFSLSSLEYGFCHPETAAMLQVDGIFSRDLPPRPPRSDSVTARFPRHGGHRGRRTGGPRGLRVLHACLPD